MFRYCTYPKLKKVMFIMSSEHSSRVRTVCLHIWYLAVPTSHIDAHEYVPNDLSTDSLFLCTF
jgi:hypothetical protein